MKSIFIALIAIIAVASSSVAQNNWTQKADFGGTARFATVGFSIGSKGYMGTGYDLLSHSNDFWEYDPTTNVWTQKADFGGTARFYAVGFSIGSKGYIGTGYDCCDFKNDFWEYDPATNVWTQKADFGGTARFYAVGFSIGSKGYIGVGSDLSGSPTSDFWEYDPAANVWTQKTNFGGTAIYAGVGFSIGNRGYIGTGVDDNGDLKNDFWEYDPVSNTWSQKAHFGGTGRYNAVGFSNGSKGYIGTGQDYSGFKNDFWEYDPATNAWTQKADFGGETRAYATGFSIGGKGYIGAGFDTNGTYYNDFWEYTPESSTCIVPKAKITPQGNLDICKIGFVNLIATAGNNYSYQWNRNNTDIPGATNPIYHAKKTGNYRVRVVDGGGCHGVSKKTTVYTSCKLDEQQSDALASEMKLYPNPTNGQFGIAMNLPDDVDTRATIQLINTLGQVVYDEVTLMTSGMLEKEIQLDDVADGMYLVKVIINDQVYSSQISYQR